MAKIFDFEGKKPEILYPLFWEYKVIFENNADAKNIVKNALGDREHTLEFSKSSQNDKYQSYNLRIFVKNESERLELFSLLKRVAKFVL